MSVISAASGVRNYTGSWTDISGTEGGRWTDGRLFGTHYIDGTTLGNGNDPLSQGRFAEKDAGTPHLLRQVLT